MRCYPLSLKFSGFLASEIEDKEMLLKKKITQIYIFYENIMADIIHIVLDWSNQAGVSISRDKNIPRTQGCASSVDHT